MAIGVTQATPLKLPEAPQKYDKRDQDHTRRLIELAFGQFAASIQATSVAIQPPVFVPKDFIPQSPILGEVIGLGVSTAALHQLLNPISANKYVLIYRINSILPDGTTTLTDRWRVTSQPVNLDAQGSPTSGTLVRMDENDVTTITSKLRTVNVASAATAFGVSQANGDTVFPISGGSIANRYEEDEIVSIDAHPIILAPGDAYEWTNGDVGGSRSNGIFVLFDEIAIATPISSVLISDPSRPISTIMGGTVTGLGTASGNAVAQLLNPIIASRKLRVLEIRVFNPFASQGKMRMRRSSNPLHMGGTVTIGTVRHLDGRNHDPIYGIVQGCTAPVEGTGQLFTEAESFYSDRVGPVSGTGTWERVLRPRSAPIFLRPGSALEVQAPDSASSSIYATFLWDEVPL